MWNFLWENEWFGTFGMFITEKQSLFPAQRNVEKWSHATYFCHDLIRNKDCISNKQNLSLLCQSNPLLSKAIHDFSQKKSRVHRFMQHFAIYIVTEIKKTLARPRRKWLLKLWTVVHQFSRTFQFNRKFEKKKQWRNVAPQPCKNSI